MHSYARKVAVASMTLGLIACGGGGGSSSPPTSTLATPTPQPSPTVAPTPSPSPSPELPIAQQIDNAMVQLSTLITELEGQSVNVEKEKMSLHTANLFMEWANWDEQNVDINASYYVNHPRYNETQAMLLAEGLADYERESVLIILQGAVDTLTDIKASGSTRRPVTLVDFSNVEINGSNLEKDGKPVFLVDYSRKPFIPELTKYYGNRGGAFIAPNQLDNSLKIKSNVRNDLLARSEESIGAVFISQDAIPSKFYDDNPGIRDGQRHYGAFDLDHPAARTWFSAMFEELVTVMRGKEYTKLGYMLFNEPSYFTRAGAWNINKNGYASVSQITLDKYETWLEAKHGSIAVLNNIWGTNYASFNDINETIPMPNALQGTPRWLDWMSFNNTRVTAWFEFMIQEVKTHDPDAKTHVKLMPWLWANSAKDHGIDFEAVINAVDIIGFDASMQNGSDRALPANSWNRKYAFDWQTAIMSFDFMSSISPDKVMYDSENHFITKVGYINPKLDPDYVRAAYWTAATHGLDTAYIWTWGRDEDGSITSGRGSSAEYVSSVAQQPLVLHEITATVMDLNSYSDEVFALQSVRKPIRVFYSNSAAINDNNYMTDLRGIYESLYFQGLPIGFVSENILATQPTSSWDVVVVYATNKMTAGELSELQNYLDNGGTVVMDTTSGQLDEYGNAQISSLTASNGTLIVGASTAELTNSAVTVASSLNANNYVTITETVNGLTRPVADKTVASRSVSIEAGKLVVRLVNYGKEPVTIRLLKVGETVSSPFSDLFTANNNLTEMTLPSFGVALLEVSI